MNVQMSHQKRPRHDGVAERVLLVPFDTPFSAVSVEASLLEEYACYTHKHVANTAPTCVVEGQPAWNSYMSRNMLLAFVKALRFREFKVPANVDYDEALKTFAYEGIGVPGNAVVSPDFTLGEYAVGVGFRMRQSTTTATMEGIAASVVNALLQWPRLDFGLQDSEMGNDPGFTCNGLRVWIAFAPRPRTSVTSVDEDPIFASAKLRAHWLYETLKAIGALHWRMAEKGVFKLDARNEDAFVKLDQQGLNIDPCAHFVTCRFDVPRHFRHAVSGADAMRTHAHQFANNCLSIVMAHGPHLPGRSAHLGDAVIYARALVQKAERMVKDSPNCARIFDGRCASTCGKSVSTGISSTPQRKALELAMQGHGAKVLQWHDTTPDGVRPLVFPPAFIGTSALSTVCVLVEMQRPETTAKK